MPSILFVCTANQFRSPLAAALLADYIRQHNLVEPWKVESAGTWATPGLPAHELASQTARRLGLPGLEKHVTRSVSRDLLERFDLVIVMETGHKESIVIEFPSVAGRVYLLSEVAGSYPYSLSDPMSAKSNPDAVLAELRSLIQKGAERMVELARANAHARQAAA